MADVMIDRDVMEEQYSDAARLAARQRLWLCHSGPSLYDTLLDLAALRGNEVIADIGCGNGAYLAELRRRGHTGRMVGLDLSEGMARAASVHAATAVADAQAVPLRDGSVDVALSLHTLYHVPDLAGAVSELRRVLRAGGAALVATNGRGHTVEAKTLLAQAATRVAGIDVDLDWDTKRFDTDRARVMLATLFNEVDVYDAGGSFSVPDPAIVRGYLASWPPESIGLRAGSLWNAILTEADRLVAAHFASHSSFTVTSRASVLIGR